MEALKIAIEDPRFILAAGGGLLMVAIYYGFSRSSQSRQARRSCSPDVVVLHQPGRGHRAPSMSPFPLKLETYLRMAKIPYENAHQLLPLSSKGKTPWITYNGEDVADSQFCIEFLNEKFNVDLDEHLSDEHKSISRAYQKMMEENFYWVYVLWKWVYDQDDSMRKASANLPSIILWCIKRTLVKQAHGQGMGRHSKDEVHRIGELDLKALSTFIADKKFLVGDEPCESDAAIFGMLAQVKWHAAGSPLEEMVMHKYNNLSEYCERMKERFWPDWDDCTTQGGKRQGENQIYACLGLIWHTMTSGKGK